MYTYTKMTKVISISDDAYNFLSKLKEEGESFSGVILKIAIEKKKPLADFCGGWHGDKEELGKIENILTEDRKKFRTRPVDLN